MVKQSIKHKKAPTKRKRVVENQEKAGISGGIEVVVKAVNTHIRNAEVCLHGCGALWNMTANGKALTKVKTKQNEQLRTE